MCMYSKRIRRPLKHDAALPAIAQALHGNLAVLTVLWNPRTNFPRRVPQTCQSCGVGTAEIAWTGPAGVAWAQGVAQAKPSESLRLSNLGSGSACT